MKFGQWRVSVGGKRTVRRTASGAPVVAVQSLRFPAAAQTDLPSAIALKLSRMSPIPVEQVIWAIGKTECADAS